MSYDHATYENYSGELGTDTDPTSTLVDGLCTKAAALLAAKIGTITYTNADEANVLNMIVDRLLARDAWKKAGFAGNVSSAAGSFAVPKEPVLWTDELCSEIYAVYGVDIKELPASSGSPWTHVTES